MTKTLLPSLLSAVFALPTFSQTSVPVQFDRGMSGKTINRTMIGKEYIEYAAGARAGHIRLVGITEKASKPIYFFFNILQHKHGDVAIYNGRMHCPKTSLLLPQNRD